MADGDVVVMALFVRPVGVTDCVAHAMLSVCVCVCGVCLCVLPLCCCGQALSLIIILHLALL